MRTVSSYTKEEAVSSSGGEITLYTTISYDIEDITIKLTGVSTRAVVNVGMLSVDYVNLRYGYWGVNYDTRGLADYTSPWFSYPSSSYSIATNPPKLECVSGGMYYEIWGEGAAHVTRGGSSWTTSHKVIECDMGWFM